MKKIMRKFYEEQLKPNDSAFWLWASVVMMIVGFIAVTRFM